MRKCFEAEAFRACVVLCGRVLETALNRKYYEVTGADLMETSPSRNFSFDSMLGSFILNCRQYGEYSDVFNSVE